MSHAQVEAVCDAGYCSIRNRCRSAPPPKQRSNGGTVRGSVGASLVDESPPFVATSSKSFPHFSVLARSSCAGLRKPPSPIIGRRYLLGKQTHGRLLLPGSQLQPRYVQHGFRPR